MKSWACTSLLGMHTLHVSLPLLAHVCDWLQLSKINQKPFQLSSNHQISSHFIIRLNFKVYIHLFSFFLSIISQIRLFSIFRYSFSNIPKNPFKWGYIRPISPFFGPKRVIYARLCPISSKIIDLSLFTQIVIFGSFLDISADKPHFGQDIAHIINF